MARENYGHPIVAWRANHRAGMGDASDDTSAMLGIGFNSLQIQQVLALHASGALSDAGYNQIVSGNVDPDNLAAYIDADPGAPQTTSGSSVKLPIFGSPTAAPPVAPGPAPRLNYPPAASFSSLFTQSSLPMMIGVVVATFLLLEAGASTATASSRRRR